MEDVNDSLGSEGVEVHDEPSKKRMDEFDYGCTDVLFTFFGAFAYMYDFVSDITAAIGYYNTGNRTYFIATSILVGVPSLLLVYMSVRLYYICEVKDEAPRGNGDGDAGNGNSASDAHERASGGDSFKTGLSLFWRHVRDSSCFRLRIFTSVLQLGPVFRAWECVSFGWRYRRSKSRGEDDTSMEKFFHLYVTEDANISLLGFFEKYLETAPQLVLQSYILVNDRLRNEAGLFGYVKVFGGLVSLVLGPAVYKRSVRKGLVEKPLMDWTVSFLYGFRVAFFLVARWFAITSFAVAFGAWVFVPLLIHVAVMLIWLSTMRTKVWGHRVEEFAFDCLLAVSCVFFYMNPKDEPTRRQYIFFYVSCFVENTILISLSLWNELALARFSCWFIVFSFCVVFVAFICSVILSFVYYVHCHPSRPKQAQQSQHEPIIEMSPLTDPS